MLRVEGFPTNGLFPQFQDFMEGGLGGRLADSIHLIIDLSADLAKINSTILLVETKCQR